MDGGQVTADCALTQRWPAPIAQVALEKVSSLKSPGGPAAPSSQVQGHKGDSVFPSTLHHHLSTEECFQFLPFLPIRALHCRAKQWLPLPNPSLVSKTQRGDIVAELRPSTQHPGVLCSRDPLKSREAQATVVFLTKGVKMGGDQQGKSPRQELVCLPCFRERTEPGNLVLCR